MAQIRLGTQDAAGVWYESGKDHGKPVKYKVRAIPHEVRQRLHREAYRDTKIRNVGRQSASAALERMESYTLLLATYALVDTENFWAAIGPDAADRYSKWLNQEVKAGAEVCLDGKWTDEIRSDVFSMARKRAAWISDKADKQTEVEVEEDEAEAEGF